MSGIRARPIPTPMKEPRNYLILILCAALLAAGTLLWQQRAEADQWKARVETAEKELAGQTAERAALEKRVREAQDQAATLQSELTAARDAQPSSAAPAPAGKKRNTMAAEGGQLTPDLLKQWLADASDPVVLRRLNTQARNQTLRRFGDLFKQLNLTPEQTDGLTKLLTDKRQAGMDVAVASYQQGNDPTQNPDDYRDQVIASHTDIENQIHALLGDANYAQYQDFTRDTGQTNLIKGLELALRNTPNPLTPDQAALIKQTLEDNGTSRITAKVVADTKDFLSPAQHQALQDLRAIQQANAQKRIQPVQILPTGASPPVAPVPAGK